jgi:hypothetical protein
LHSCCVDGGSNRTSVSIHGLRYLLTALRRQGLIPDEPVLQLATFLRSHDLFLELRVRTPRTLTANQARQGGKQGTDGRGRSRIHFRCLALTSLLRSLGPKINYLFNVEIILERGRRCSGPIPDSTEAARPEGSEGQSAPPPPTPPQLPSRWPPAPPPGRFSR